MDTGSTPVYSTWKTLQKCDVFSIYTVYYYIGTKELITMENTTTQVTTENMPQNTKTTAAMAVVGTILQTINRLLEKYGLYCFAAAVLLLNYSLAFDNVVWGDEAFSGGTIYGTDLYGIFQRIYYWDSHPPLYYYWLRLWADIFGYTTPVYHFASLFPFTVGIVMAVTLFKKNFGTIPAAFFVLLSGLSAPCAEYNLEIRMYALVFLELLVCAWCSYFIVNNNSRKLFWILLTLFGVAAAYTHYYGLVVSGILLFVTGLIYFLRNRGRTWLYGVIAIIAYILLYSPWLVVFVRQTMSVGNSWWMSDIAPLNVLTELLFCGADMRTLLMPFTIGMSLLILVIESELLHLSLPGGSRGISWQINKPGTGKWSKELYGIVLFWSVIALTILFTYVASLIINPLTVARYMYPLVPMVLFILMLCIRRLLAYGKVAWGREEYGSFPEVSKSDAILLVNPKSAGWSRTVLGLVAAGFAVMLVIGLFDFKEYRSIVKTQDVETGKVLEIVGEPDKEAVFTATGVKHLSWTVLSYYYPDNQIYGDLPDEIDTDADEIWAFIGSDIFAESLENSIQQMLAKGYAVEEYKGYWMGKYGCDLYHFTKNNE